MASGVPVATRLSTCRDSGIATGKHRNTIRHADGVGDICAVEPKTLPGKCVEVWRLGNGITVAPKTVTALLIGTYQNHVHEISSGTLEGTY